MLIVIARLWLPISILFIVLAVKNFKAEGKSGKADYVFEDYITKAEELEKRVKRDSPQYADVKFFFSPPYSSYYAFTDCGIYYRSMNEGRIARQGIIWYAQITNFYYIKDDLKWVNFVIEYMENGQKKKDTLSLKQQDKTIFYDRLDTCVKIIQGGENN